MAPTIVGWHKTAKCVHCGQNLIISSPAPDAPKYMFFDEPNQIGICSQCLKASNSEAALSEVFPSDRVIADKLLAPRRWDLIVYRHPPEPANRLVHRLVGLPGEEVVIKEGAIWINGEKLTPPEPISLLQYTTELSGFGPGKNLPTDWGSSEKPIRLKDDEFCVLGDFSLRSNDSRVWGPVPRANIEGVVTLRYWPISRWHVWR